jgi:CubicO group peptidase (beta-lactamase class C family)
VFVTKNVRCGGWRVLALLLMIAVGALIARPASAQEVTPERVTAAVAQLDSLAEQTLERTGVPGVAIAVVYQDQVVYMKGFGVREEGKEGRVDPDTVFQLASVSKPIGSTLMAMLVGEGVITWDDPIVSHDPGFALADPWVTSNVTLRDMYSHRSGLPEYAGDLLEGLEFSREQILHNLRYLALGDRFRADYAYTNFGITAAGVAAAKAAGGTWEDVITERLFVPLGMTSTSPRSADFFARADRAYGHVLEDGSYVAKYRRDPDTESPAGGVSSSVRDLTQWMRLQLGNGAIDGRQLVDAAALAETHRPEIVSNQPQNPSTDRAGFYGLGWNVSYTNQGAVQLGHSGAFDLGAATTVYMLPASELGIIVLTNAAPVGAPEAVALSFLDLATTGTVSRDWLTALQPLFDALYAAGAGYSTDYSNPPAPPAPALPLSAYTGAYTNDFFGEIEIVEQDGGLVILEGPMKMAFPMRHYDHDLFIYQPTGESAGGLSGVTFTIGPDGEAISVVVENLNIHGVGTFTRETEPR